VTIGVIVTPILLLVILAAMPWGAFKSGIESRLSARFGRPVTIGSVKRVDAFSLWPTIRVRDLRIPQADWAGKGYLAVIPDVTVRFPALPLLIGRFRPEDIVASGGQLSLVRDAQRRVNWSKGGQADRRGGGDTPSLEDVTITNMHVTYRDAVQSRSFDVLVNSDRRQVRIAGTGIVRGAPVTVGFAAPAIHESVGRPWPFRLDMAGKDLTMRVTGTMRHVLDSRHMHIAVAASASDLKMIDAIIEAGLFGTQPVKLSARASRDGGDWTVEALHGTIGRSDISGKVAVTKHDGRTRLSGSLTSNAMNFDDLASNEGQAKAIALERAEGPKLVPNMRVNLAKIVHTDGIIDFNVKSVIGGRRPSSIKSVSGKLTLDHQFLVVSGLRIGLSKGAITGSVKVDQRNGGAVPLVTLDLRLADSSVDALAGGGIDAGFAGRVRLTGRGSTIREAVGTSNGSIGLAATNGILPARIAALIGFDVGRGLTTDTSQTAALRCAVGRFVVRGGRAVADPLLIDTSMSQSRGSGTITFPQEALALSLTGAPKQDSTLRLPGSVTLAGTIRTPQLTLPKESRSLGNVLKGIGRAITGHQGPRATDADCGALVARALG
jgi:uncharacterized protein involved in outer membrane biogenesis